MNITVKPKITSEKKLTASDVKPGFIFKYLNSGIKPEQNVVALKLYKGIALLKYSSGDDWFELKNSGSWENSPVKILGKITEIIVDPNLEIK